MNELQIAFPSPKIGISVTKKTKKDNGMGLSTRYVNAPPCRDQPERFLKYEYAQDLANEISIEKGCRFFVVLNGTFIAGDFIEALVTKNNWHVKRMTVSTLSMSQGNVDSFGNLIHGGFIDKLDLILSDHFFANERHKNGLVPYLYSELDTDKCDFQLSVARTHCKITTIETHCGLKVVIHGSANLRSSDNIEQIQIEENELLHNFNVETVDLISEKYKTINKAVRLFKS